MTDRTLLFAQQAFPNQNLNTHRVQLGVLIEEVAELLASFQLTDASSDMDRALAMALMERLGNTLKSGSSPHNPDTIVSIVVKDHRDHLDALADVRVMTYSTAHAAGYDFQGAIDNIDDSNFSKFLNGKPLYSENGKLLKGPHYVAPDLTPFIKQD